MEIRYHIHYITLHKSCIQRAQKHRYKNTNTNINISLLTCCLPKEPAPEGAGCCHAYQSLIDIPIAMDPQTSGSSST